MAPIDPEKLELAELNLTGEGRALQCLNEAACPGGAELPLDPAKPMCSEGHGFSRIFGRLAVSVKFQDDKSLGIAFGD